MWVVIINWTLLLRRPASCGADWDSFGFLPRLNKKISNIWSLFSPHTVKNGFHFVRLWIITHQMVKFVNLSPRNVSYYHLSAVRGAGPVCCHLALMWSWLAPGRSPWYRDFSTGAVKSDSHSVHSGYIDWECVEIEGMCVFVAERERVGQAQRLAAAPLLPWITSTLHAAFT